MVLLVCEDPSSFLIYLISKTSTVQPTPRDPGRRALPPDPGPAFQRGIGGRDGGRAEGCAAAPRPDDLPACCPGREGGMGRVSGAFCWVACCWELGEVGFGSVRGDGPVEIDRHRFGHLNNFFYQAGVKAPAIVVARYFGESSRQHE